MIDEVISRKEAIDKGMKTYFTGVQCKNGHIDYRRVDNKTCNQCIKKHNTVMGLLVLDAKQHPDQVSLGS